MAYIPALGANTIDDLLNMIAQRRALGQSIPPSSIDRYVSSYIQAMYPYVLEQARATEQLAEQQRQFDIGTQLKREEMEGQKQAEKTQALTSLLGTGAMAGLTYMMMKPQMALTEKVLQMAAGTPTASASQATLTAKGVGAGVGPFQIDKALVPSTTGTTPSVPSALSSITESPYFVPGVAGALRTGIGLISGEKPGQAVVSGLGSAGGAYAGGAAGTALGLAGGGPIGAIIGAVLGGEIGRAISKACIIVTACCGDDSEEVNVAREFRDRYLSPEILRGYYYISERVVPYMIVFPAFKQLVKEKLVDKLIEYGKAVLTNTRPSRESTIVTMGFLRNCLIIGRQLPCYVRVNGEIV